MTVYARALRRATLAQAHARSGDAIAIAELPRQRATAFDRALASFAEAYADQNERDYRALQDAVAVRPRRQPKPACDGPPPR